MSNETSKLWLFDYNVGLTYEKFSQCEDSEGLIFKYLRDNYDFSDKTVLEIGAGSGKFTKFLAESCKKLYVAERSPSLMKINKEKNNLENAEFVLTDVKHLELPEKTVDVVFGGWSMTSMRDAFPEIFKVLKSVLKDDGKIILVENAGDDEFAAITGIEGLTLEMRDLYKRLGFSEKTVLSTCINLPNESVFYDVFPNQKDVKLDSLQIQHNVLILETDFLDFWR